jgi:hypothetical protein
MKRALSLIKHHTLVSARIIHVCVCVCVQQLGCKKCNFHMAAWI